MARNDTEGRRQRTEDGRQKTEDRIGKPGNQSNRVQVIRMIRKSGYQKISQWISDYQSIRLLFFTGVLIVWYAATCLPDILIAYFSDALISGKTRRWLN